MTQHQIAAKLKKDFKVPDKRYWWIKVQALAGMRDWVKLKEFSQERRSPIG